MENLRNQSLLFATVLIFGVALMISGTLAFFWHDILCSDIGTLGRCFSPVDPVFIVTVYPYRDYFYILLPLGLVLTSTAIGGIAHLIIQAHKSQ